MARHRAALNHDASTSWSTDLSPDSLRLWDKNIPAPSPPCSPRFSSRHLSLGGGDGGGGGAFEKNAYRVHTRTDHARARFVRSLTRFPRSLIMARLCRVKIRYPWGGGRQDISAQLRNRQRSCVRSCACAQPLGTALKTVYPRRRWVTASVTRPFSPLRARGSLFRVSSSSIDRSITGISMRMFIAEFERANTILEEEEVSKESFYHTNYYSKTIEGTLLERKRREEWLFGKRLIGRWSRMEWKHGRRTVGKDLRKGYCSTSWLAERNCSRTRDL